ncbi:MAG: hypothetical protein NTY09_06160 [bacterium]|nr:hypothetical protein [bacterium]
MTFRTIAFFALIFALISVGIYWFVNRPTVEERALIGFFGEFKQGKYEEAQAYTAVNDFWQMASKTSVIDTSGAEYTIGDYFPEESRLALQISIESYVKPHIAKWKYLFMDTQRLSEARSVVHFRIELGIRDFSSGNLIAEADEGRVEGTAYMVLKDGEWKVDRFDLALFSDQDLELAPYLEEGN